VANQSKQRLVDKLQKMQGFTASIAAPQKLGEYMRKAYLDMDNDMLEMPMRKLHEGEDMSGCTALSVLITDKHIICANAGDSRSVMGTNGTTVELSYDHKPTNPEEKSRIENAGGTVTNKRVNGDLAVSRALGDYGYKKTTRCRPEEQQVQRWKEGGRGCHDFETRIFDMVRLGMPRFEACNRILSDLRTKSKDSMLTTLVCILVMVVLQVSAEPEIKIVDRAPGDEFVILACDGIWDVMSRFFIHGRRCSCLGCVGSHRTPIPPRSPPPACFLVAAFAFMRPCYLGSCTLFCFVGGACTQFLSFNGSPAPISTSRVENSLLTSVLPFFLIACVSSLL
jgi:serine/threonine protein phosphatase PrpC